MWFAAAVAVVVQEVSVVAVAAQGASVDVADVQVVVDAIFSPPPAGTLAGRVEEEVQKLCPMYRRFQIMPACSRGGLKPEQQISSQAILVQTIGQANTLKLGAFHCKPFTALSKGRRSIYMKY